MKIYKYWLAGNRFDEEELISALRSADEDFFVDKEDFRQALVREGQLFKRKAELEKDLSRYRNYMEDKLSRIKTQTQQETLIKLADTIRCLELALLTEENTPSLRSGVSAVVREIQKIFEQHDLKRIPTEGQLFNPSLHDAVATQDDSKLRKGTILKEISPGYSSQNRTVLCSKVIVAK